ncbi:Phospholipase_D-nuclease N-terminal [Dethiosulfatibacter aminovorans DSM 17477]|uniref:Phospholipase_D-nuclease N-terminal n=1 Tax=Dethiosulfatibacter aminovorans DSM 17477 TaxID=1121476 RepID=A0A1M6IRQ8_9FIRM|nr:PLDc N-terminal domain-containing protein [Dethiosulfatibacter aminovorans]SHJ37058.1 Phospholipase_D-nuclease N-terminal [Dethiosulfatibacter aminovorans DSM 17477]
MIGFAFIPFMMIFIFQLFLAIFVYNDSKKRGMNPVLWVLITILMPNLIGFIIYLVVRSQSSQWIQANKPSGRQSPDYSRRVDTDKGYGKDYDRVSVSSRSAEERRCQTCGRTLTGNPYKCPYCGAEVYNEMFDDGMAQANAARKSIIAVLAILLAVGMLFFAFIALTPFRYMNIEEVIDTFKYEIFRGEDQNTSSVISSKYSYWDGTKEKTIDVDRNGVLEIEFELVSKEGIVYAVLKDDDNNIMYNFPGNAREIVVFDVQKGDRYYISVVGQEAKGSYKFEWRIK